MRWLTLIIIIIIIIIIIGLGIIVCVNININICSIELRWDGKITKIWYDNEMRLIRITVRNGRDL